MFCCILVSVSFQVLSLQVMAADELAVSKAWIQDRIEELGNDSYLVRKSAARSLSDSRHGARVREMLVDALRHESLEVRHQSFAILQQFELQAFEEQLARLSDASCSSEEISLPSWKRFSAIAGNDRAARNLFAQIVRRFGNELRKVDRENRIENLETEFDPYRIPNGNPLRWSVLLMCDQSGVNHGVSDLSHRVVIALCNSGLGPKTKTSDEQTVIRRLIRHWIDTHSHVGTPREHLLIAMRFGCRDQADEICSQVFANDNASPSAQVTAMLVASVLRRSDLSSQLEIRLEDDRTAHVWQLIASQKTKIRTQIRDVALALMLHQHGIDPRQAGFDELQADPLLVFRDHSLGFPNEELRRTSVTRARELLKSESRLEADRGINR